MKRLIFLFLGVIVSITTFGQIEPMPDTTDLSNLSLEELSQLRSRYKATATESTIAQAIETASRKPLSLRNSPSIISVITEEQIQRSGATDLMDVLHMVPGLEFNVDVEGAIGISFRGLWTNEGSILLELDGQELNENAYSGLAFGNHYPINNIKRIEVIRGPGSALYGGYAEYAVINIITKSGDEIHGAKISAQMAGSMQSYSQQNVSISAGNKIKDFSYSITGLLGRGQRSDGNYTDVYGQTVSLKGQSAINPHFADLNMSYKGLSVSLIYDNYITGTRDGYISALSQSYPCNFLSYMGELRYTRKISKKLHTS
jgi:outer membrane receptor for ferrienterochelin and colicin